MEFLVLHRSPDLTAWQVSQSGRNSVRREHLYSHLDQTEKGTGEIRSRPAAPIDERSDPGDDTAVRAHNVDHFPDLAAARHDVFRDNKSFVRRNGETTEGWHRILTQFVRQLFADPRPDLRVLEQEGALKNCRLCKPDRSASAHRAMPVWRKSASKSSFMAPRPPA
jgi:hypothetical protein